MTTQFDYNVFPSHSHKDKPVARELANQLKQDGLRVLPDESGIQPDHTNRSKKTSHAIGKFQRAAFLHSGQRPKPGHSVTLFGGRDCL